MREQTKMCDVIITIKKLKSNWAGHVAKCNNNRWPREILNCIPKNEKRLRKYLQDRWVNEIKGFVGFDWKWKTFDQKKWKKLGNLPSSYSG